MNYIPIPTWTLGRTLTLTYFEWQPMIWSQVPLDSHMTAILVKIYTIIHIVLLWVVCTCRNFELAKDKKETIRSARILLLIS